MSLFVVVSACSGSPSESAIERALRTPLPVDPGPDEGGQALRDEIFADGVVTYEEYERAVLAEVECVRRQGFEISSAPEPSPPRPGLAPPGDLVFSVVWVEGVEDVMDRCASQWRRHVEWAWIAQNEPTEAERQAWLERAADCGAARGIPIVDIERDWPATLMAGCRPWEG